MKSKIVLTYFIISCILSFPDMEKTLVIKNKKALLLMKNCVGCWRFSYANPYTISIKINKNAIELELYESNKKKWLLTHLKSTEWFMELFAFSEKFDDSMKIRIYPHNKAKIGLEVSKITTFNRESTRVQTNNDRVFEDFIAKRGGFPDWIQGEWYNTSLGFRMHIIIKKEDTVSISIEQEEESTENVTIVDTGYIGYSGIYMSLDCKNWLDRPILFEFVFDAYVQQIFCIMKMMVRTEKMSERYEKS